MPPKEKPGAGDGTSAAATTQAGATGGAPTTPTETPVQATPREGAAPAFPSVSSSGGFPDGAEEIGLDDLAALEVLGLGDLGADGLSKMRPPAPGEEEAMFPRGRVTPVSAGPGGGGGLNEATMGQGVAYEVGNATLKALQAQFEGGKIEPQDDWTRVICMRMGRPGKKTGSLYGWGAYGLDRMDFTPFARSPVLHPLLVKSITTPKPHRRYGFFWNHFWREPPKNMVDPKTGKELAGGHRGTCNGRMTFRDQVTGHPISTCVYANCPHHPLPPGLWHSIWMAQLFVSRLRNDSVIKQYVKRYDPRPEVGHFASLVITERNRRLMEDMGMGGQEQTNLFF